MQSKFVPEYQINEDCFLIVLPEILLKPQLSAPSISLYNTIAKTKTLEIGTKLFSLFFNAQSIFLLRKEYKDIVSHSKYNTAVLNYGLHQHLINLVSRVSFLSTVNHPICAAKIKKEPFKKFPNPAKVDPFYPNVIQDQNHEQAGRNHT